MSYTDIQADQLDELLQTEGLVIIDQRDDATRAAGTLPNAQPASDALVGALVKQRRQDPPVLVYCYRGNQSRDLCAFLGQLGLGRVYNLAGGWDAWEKHAQAAPGSASAYAEWLSSRGFDVDDLNSRIDMGMSPLMQAALEGEHAMVDALLEAGADHRQLNDDHHHALWFACVNGDPALVRKLIGAGSNLNNRNVNGVTCIVYAASTGKLEVLQTLVDAGADPHIATDDGVTALEGASTLPVLRYLRQLTRKAS